jgi:hypothetical protein
VRRQQTNEWAFSALARLGINPIKHGLGFPDGHRGWRRSGTPTKKFLLVARWTLVLITKGRQRSKRLASTKALRGSAVDKVALVVGAGALGCGQNEKAVAMASRKLEATVLVMNNFQESTLFDYLSPDFWLMLDLAAQETELCGDSPVAWEEIKRSTVTAVVPWQYLEGTSHAKKLAVDNDSLAGIIKNTSPLWPRGYEGKSCLKAVCFASFLGFETIYVVGCENDYFREVSITHGIASGKDNSYLGTQAASDYFQNIANEFAYERMVLEKIRSRVIRLDKEALAKILN